MKRQGMQTVTQRPDAQSQRYIQGMRHLGQQGLTQAMGGPDSYVVPQLSSGAIAAAMNPWMNEVIGGVRGEFDFLRDQALLEENARATGAGAYGGDRSALAQGARLGAIDRAQGSQVAGLLGQGYGQALQLAEHRRQLAERGLQEPLWRYGQGLNFLNLGMGPVGTTTEQWATGGGNRLAGALGGAATGSAFGLPGAIAGGLIGAFGS